MFVIVNPSAGGGTAPAKWRRVETRLRQRVGLFTAIAARSPANVQELVAKRLDQGETEFVAAGGDGTVNLVMSSIVEHAPPALLKRVKLGAIGLGSSNDFHKPLCGATAIAGVPCKLDFRQTVEHDVCLLTYKDEADNLRSRRWFINASLGTTAEANQLFNSPDRVLRFLKRISTSGGIAYAAVRTILRYRSGWITMTFDDGERIRARVKNLGIVKNPHFTGALRYDSPYEPNSGYFYVHLLRDVSILRLALALLRLLRGKFSGQMGAQSWRARQLTIEADEPFAVEGDGEVITTKRALFSVTPRLLQVCT